MYKTADVFNPELINFRKEQANECLILDTYQHPMLYDLARCSNCENTCIFKNAEDQGWWIDELKSDCRGSKNLADLCDKCRENERSKYENGSAQCERCTRFGEYGLGKWNIGPDETGRMTINYTHRCTLCYKCNGLISRNK